MAEMAKLHPSWFLTILLFTSCLLQHVIASYRPSSPLRLSLRLPSPRPCTYKTNRNCSVQQPLTPFFFGDEPLSRFDGLSQAYARAGSAHGLYLADPAASMELRFLSCTLLMAHEGVVSADEEAKGSGSIALMGSPSTGAIAVIGGTGSFAFASGQAKVSMEGIAGSESDFLNVHLDILELQVDEGDFATA